MTPRTAAMPMAESRVTSARASPTPSRYSRLSRAESEIGAYTDCSLLRYSELTFTYFIQQRQYHRLLVHYLFRTRLLQVCTSGSLLENTQIQHCTVILVLILPKEWTHSNMVAVPRVLKVEGVGEVAGSSSFADDRLLYDIFSEELFARYIYIHITGLILMLLSMPHSFRTTFSAQSRIPYKLQRWLNCTYQSSLWSWLKDARFCGSRKKESIAKHSAHYLFAKVSSQGLAPQTQATVPWLGNGPWRRDPCYNPPSTLGQEGEWAARDRIYIAVRLSNLFRLGRGIGRNRHGATPLICTLWSSAVQSLTLRIGEIIRKIQWT